MGWSFTESSQLAVSELTFVGLEGGVFWHRTLRKYRSSPFNAYLNAVVGLKTAVHEIRHVLNIGEADEGSDEIYSGNGNDPTPERVIDKRGRTSTYRFWSVMSSGTNDDQYLPPTNETYFAFSIEELFTIDTSDTAIKDDDDE